MLLALAALLPAASISNAAKAPVDEPFWTGHPNAAQYTKLNQERIANAKAEIAKMLAVKGKRTVENTLVPYDEAGRWLDMAGSQAGLMENVSPDSNVRAAAEKMGQDVSAYATEISLNRGVYDALSAIDLTGADDETRYYVQHDLRDFRLAGVDKDEATRKKIKELRDELVKIGQEWTRNIRDNVRTVKAKPEELTGLPQDFIDSHKPDASGMVTLDINYPDYIPTMTYCRTDDLRKRLYMEYQNRAYPQNIEVLKRMMQKRYELANLLGYTNWADYITANKMSGSAKVVRDFIDKIVAASSTAQQRDYETLLNRKKKDFPDATGVNFWEQVYWSELVKRSDYDFDSQSIRPYLAYDQVKQGVLDVTSKMFGVTYKQVKDAPVWDPSVECYEVWDGNKLYGRFYLDMHPRPNKYNHAAQFDVRTGIAGKQLPEATLVCNLPGGKPGDPGLCEIDDVDTFFHEFGHLLHTIFAGHRKWCGTGGIRTEHDFVEAPSQMLENWIWDKQVLDSFAADYRDPTKKIPADILAKLKEARLATEGTRYRRQLAFGLLDLALHTQIHDTNASATLPLSNATLGEVFLPPAPDTAFVAYFNHIIGYGAGYYGYAWADAISADMATVFETAPDGYFDQAAGLRLRREIYEPGDSRDVNVSIEKFLGRPRSIEPFLKQIGIGK
jgi:thimet oligopeptidase